MPTFLYVVAFLLFGWFMKKLADSSSDNRRSAPYPPGPKPKPVIGNALDFPKTNAHEVYVKWGKKYRSDFVYGSAFGNKILILNKLEDADELLEQRAKKYSSRPLIPTTELMGWDSWNFALFPYGKTWRFHRQISQQNFRSEAAVGYQPLMLKKAHEMCNRLLLDSTNFEQHNKMLSISMTMMAMYGYEVKSFDDPCIAAATESTTLSAPLLYPGATLVNVIPGLAKMPIPTWFPGAKTWKMATRVRDLGKIAERIPFEFVKESIERRDSVCQILRKEELVNPEVQRKAQAEIDRVVGHSRLPDFGDRPVLPYLEAIYRELLRFAPPLPLGVPHATTEDDFTRDTLFLKGNDADEDLYKEPSSLDQKGSLTKVSVYLSSYARENSKLTKCEEYVLVNIWPALQGQMWIIVASVLACFTIEKAKDDSGNEIEIPDDYDDLGALLHKSKFRCSFVPRSTLTKQLLTEQNDP
ncbi:cytochrome P450 [Gymnopilus junonius]|uniref:Cytochrome P450 n=1 Tax=Gymnopilus junonius TaxID=109634 RepID=A0A9P5TJF9_GYMJU|nr:cytochrome P450 [Gymnopilus junonius]